MLNEHIIHFPHSCQCCRMTSGRQSCLLSVESLANRKPEPADLADSAHADRNPSESPTPPGGGAVFHGGAGNRTPVRASIRNRFYVRRSRLLVFPTPRPTGRAGNKPPSDLTCGAEGAHRRPARCDAQRRPRAQPPSGWCAQPKRYAAKAKSVLAIVCFPSFYPGSGNLGTPRKPHKTRRSLSPPYVSVDCQRALH